MPSCATAAECFRKRASLARGGRANRQPREQCRSSDLFGGCGSNPVHAKNKGEGFAPLAARPRRSKAHFASPSDYRGYASMPAPPLPTHLLRIRMGALKKAHRAVQFAPFSLVPVLLVRKPLALLRALPSCVTAAGCLRKRASLARGGRSRLHPRIPLFIRSAETGSRQCLLPVSVGGRRGIRTPGGFHLNGFQDRRDRPLRHPSVSVALKGSRFLLFEGAFPPFPRRRPRFQNSVPQWRQAFKFPFSAAPPLSELHSPAAPRVQSPFSQRCAPRKKSAKVPAPECVPMTFPT